MRSEGFSFCFEGLGVETCSLDAAFVFANRPQPSAARPRWGPYSRAYGERCKSGHFGGFKRCVTSLQAWHFPTFQHVS